MRLHSGRVSIFQATVFHWFQHSFTRIKTETFDKTCLTFRLKPNLIDKQQSLDKSDRDSSIYCSDHDLFGFWKLWQTEEVYSKKKYEFFQIVLVEYLPSYQKQPSGGVLCTKKNSLCVSRKSNKFACRIRVAEAMVFFSKMSVPRWSLLYTFFR